ANLGRQLAAMGRHPRIVPAQHEDGDPENAGVEVFLPGALESAGNRAGEDGHENGAGQSGRYAGPNPETTAGEPARRRQHDADDQAGFDRFAKDNDESGNHRSYSARIAPWAVSSWYSP